MHEQKKKNEPQKMKYGFPYTEHKPNKFGAAVLWTFMCIGGIPIVLPIGAFGLWLIGIFVILIWPFD